MGHGMTFTEFEKLVSAYGSSPDRWPEDRRAAADAFYRQSEEAQALVRQEAELDTLLQQLPVADVSERLKAAILASAPAVTIGANQAADVAVSQSDIEAGFSIGRILDQASAGLRTWLGEYVPELSVVGAAPLRAGITCASVACLGLMIGIATPYDSILSTSDEDLLAEFEEGVFVLAYGEDDNWEASLMDGAEGEL